MIQKLTDRQILQSGSGYIELVIIIPLLLFLMIGAVELGRALKVHSAMNIMARGLASSAFRDCSIKTTPSTLQSCLDGVIGSTTLIAKKLLPQVTLTVSVYRWKGEPIFAGISPVERETEITGERSTRSRFSVSFFDPLTNPDSNTMLKDNGTIVFGEVFVPYSAYFPLMPKIFSLSKGMFYVTAAY